MNNSAYSPQILLQSTDSDKNSTATNKLELNLRLKCDCWNTAYGKLTQSKADWIALLYQMIRNESITSYADYGNTHVKCERMTKDGKSIRSNKFLQGSFFPQVCLLTTTFVCVFNIQPSFLIHNTAVDCGQMWQNETKEKLILHDTILTHVIIQMETSVSTKRNGSWNWSSFVIVNNLIWSQRNAFLR